MRRSLLVLVVTAAVLVASTAGAWALQRGPGERATEIKEERAEQVKERIELIITRFNNNKDRHIAVYNEIKDKLKEMADQLDQQGYDTTRIREDYRKLDEMIVDAAKDYKAFIDQLSECLDLTPGDGQFSSTLQEARDLLREFRMDLLSIRHFYQTAIRPDLEELRSQNPQGTNLVPEPTSVSQK